MLNQLTLPLSNRPLQRCIIELLQCLHPTAKMNVHVPMVNLASDSNVAARPRISAARCIGVKLSQNSDHAILFHSQLFELVLPAVAALFKYLCTQLL